MDRAQLIALMAAILEAGEIAEAVPPGKTRLPEYHPSAAPPYRVVARAADLLVAAEAKVVLMDEDLMRNAFDYPQTRRAGWHRPYTPQERAAIAAAEEKED